MLRLPVGLPNDQPYDDASPYLTEKLKFGSLLIFCQTSVQAERPTDLKAYQHSGRNRE